MVGVLNQTPEPERGQHRSGYRAGVPDRFHAIELDLSHRLHRGATFAPASFGVFITGIVDLLLSFGLTCISSCVAETSGGRDNIANLTNTGIGYYAAFILPTLVEQQQQFPCVPGVLDRSLCA